MNDLHKHLSTCLLATAALLVGAAPAWAQAPILGAASGFSVLGGTNVTCTGPASVVGDVGVSPGVNPKYTNTGCVITGATPPATDAAAATARTNFLDAYALQVPQNCDLAHTLAATITGPMTLAPGTYCTGAALTGTGALILDGGGNPNAVWIFKIGAALTGANFSVIMTNGGQPCNVYWVPGAGVTMTNSAISGNILAGDATLGSVTMTDGTVAGRVLANVAITMTRTNVIGCTAGPGSPPSVCKDKDRDHDGHDKDHKKCDDGHDRDNGKGKCDDEKDGHKDHESDARYPFESKHDDQGKDGKGGKK